MTGSGGGAGGDSATAGTTYDQMIGRAELDDIEAILAITNTDADAETHRARDFSDTVFTWNYGKGERPGLAKLYEKAKTSQWNAERDLPWELDVDPYKLIVNNPRAELNERVLAAAGDEGQPTKNWTTKEKLDLQVEMQNWTLSQFLHGEQGALVCTAKIVETVPWIDAKYFAATQVIDEARHVEVFAKYLNTKLTGHYPINAHLRMLLDDIIADSRWDMTYLGMQVMVEGLALAAFGFMQLITDEPLLKKLLRYVMSDEARHVAFGVLSLQEHYSQLTDAEMLERQEFAFEAAVRMRDRFLHQEVWERMGLDVRTMVRLTLEHSGSRNGDPFQQLLFAKIVPNCKKLGLLDRNDGWLRKRFGELGVLQFENMLDTGEEHELLDELAKDRAAAEGAAAANDWTGAVGGAGGVGGTLEAGAA